LKFGTVVDVCAIAPIGVSVCASAGVTALAIKAAAAMPATQIAASAGFRLQVFLGTLIVPSNSIVA
jgi:hypothetical protein